MSYLTQVGERTDYEPELARVVCQHLGLIPLWHNLPMMADLAGKRVGDLADSTNITWVNTFPDAIAIPFPSSDQMLPEMLAALRAGDIDALIDDELVLVVAAQEDDRLEIGFTLPTQVPFAIATPKYNPALQAKLNAALATTLADGTLAALWATWIPWKPFPQLGI